MANTSDTAEQTARNAMTQAIDTYARLTGYIDDDHTITSYVIATAAEDLEGHHETGAITSHPMPPHQIHGLLSYVDLCITGGDYYTSDDTEDEDADGNL